MDITRALKSVNTSAMVCYGPRRHAANKQQERNLRRRGRRRNRKRRSSRNESSIIRAHKKERGLMHSILASRPFLSPCPSSPSPSPRPLSLPPQRLTLMFCTKYSSMLFLKSSLSKVSAARSLNSGSETKTGKRRGTCGRTPTSKRTKGKMRLNQRDR